jgi:hypothetical protein
MATKVFLGALLVGLVFGAEREPPSKGSYYEKPRKFTIGYEYVTCGSSLKLSHIGSDFRLHSHKVQYGTGSKQQVRFEIHFSY